jgi:hypothetical protein
MMGHNPSTRIASTSLHKWLKTQRIFSQLLRLPRANRVIYREYFQGSFVFPESKVGSIPPAGSCRWAELVPQTGNTTEQHADRVDLSRESLCDLILLPAE